MNLWLIVIVFDRTTSLHMGITRRTTVTFHLTRGRRSCSCE